jgi:hypothetical protein
VPAPRVLSGRLTPVAAVLTILAACAQPAAAQSWKDLETRGAVIDGIEVVVRDVFDVTRRAEDTWIGRAANALHLETRQNVVRRALLFGEGDRVDAGRIQETERNLRRLAFVREARIVPVRMSDQSAWARVEVDDAWSLQADLDLRQAGGSRTWGLRIEELNLLGRGKRAVFAHERNLERTASGVGYTDPQFLGSRWIVSLGYTDLSDGASRLAFVERPYDSIDSRFAVSALATTAERTLTLYNQGDPVYLIPVRRSAVAFAASHAYIVRDRTAFRLGVSYRDEDSQFDAAVPRRVDELPEPDTSRRRIRGFAGSWSVVQDRPAVFQNLASIGRTEDYGLGWFLGMRLGYASKRLGSTTGAPFGDITVRKGWRVRSAGVLLMDGAIRGRRGAEGWRDAASRLAATIYRPVRWGQTLAAHTAFVSVTRLDSGDGLYLGAGDGLRGYVDHFLAGDRRVTVSVEDRLITSWRPLGLVQAGFVAYADAGAIRRADTGRWSRPYANVGAGLRFGNLKSAFGRLLQVSLAMPLVREPGMDRVLLVLGSPVPF